MQKLEPELVKAIAQGARRIELCAYTHLVDRSGDEDKNRTTMRRAVEAATTAAGHEPTEYHIMALTGALFIAGDGAYIGEFVKQPGFEKMMLNGGILMTYSKGGVLADITTTDGIEL
jgi:N-methylhydantoinase A/oxoprolinase/acetone carboxylase beta subunit